MHARQQRVRAAVEKLQSKVSTHVGQHVVVADAKRILGSEAIWIPTINRRKRARIGSDQRGDGKDAMAILAAARSQSGKHSVAHPRKNASAVAAVVQRIIFQSFGERVASRGSYCRNPKVRPESFGVTFHSLAPLRRSIAKLADTSRHRGPPNWVR